MLWSRAHLSGLADRGGQYISIRYTFSILVKEARIACAVSDAVSCIYYLIVEYIRKAQARQSEAENQMRP